MLQFWQAIITAAVTYLGWPIAVLTLGLVFKRNIAELLARLTRFTVRRGDTSFEAQSTMVSSALEQVISADAPNAGPLSLPAPRLERAFETTDVVKDRALNQVAVDDEERKRVINFGTNSPTVKAREELIRAQLARLKFDLDDPLTVEVLIRNVAYSQTITAFETFYRLIFGSQLAVIRSLSKGPMNEDQLLGLFQRAKKRFPKFYASYTYEEWRDFLINQGAILHDPERGVYELTTAGREFLIWMVNTGVSENKYG